MEIKEELAVNLREMLLGGGGLVIILLTVVQISPIEFNPWSAIAGAIGRAFNVEVLRDMEELSKAQRKTQEALERHIRDDDDRNADTHRERILRFNLELMRNIYHSREEFIEVLAEIDDYERYCDDHKDYKNNRANCAVNNIRRVYTERVQKHDFREV